MPFIMAFVIMAVILGGITIVSHIYSLNRIKSKTVGDGQHGTARWVTKAEIRRTYEYIVIHLRDGEKRHKGAYSRQQAMKRLYHKDYL